MLWQTPKEPVLWSEIGRSVFSALQRRGDVFVDLISWPEDLEKKLTGYEFIVWGYPVESWFPKKLHEGWKEMLGRSGFLAGKKTAVFSGPGNFGLEKTLVMVMNSLEGEGMFVRDFKGISNSREGSDFAKFLKLLPRNGV